MSETWHMHWLGGRETLVWTCDDGPTARAVAADATGVHPRLFPEDFHAVAAGGGPVLTTPGACVDYAVMHGLGDVALGVLLSAYRAVDYIRRGDVQWIRTEAHLEGGHA